MNDGGGSHTKKADQRSDKHEFDAAALSHITATEVNDYGGDGSDRISSDHDHERHLKTEEKPARPALEQQFRVLPEKPGEVQDRSEKINSKRRQRYRKPFLPRTKNRPGKVGEEYECEKRNPYRKH